MREVEAIVSKRTTLFSRGRAAENFALLEKTRKFLADHLLLNNVVPKLQKNPYGNGPQFGTLL